MPTKPHQIPAYRLHNPAGLGVVRLDGRDHYLGKHGTPASREAYRRTVAEWISAGTAAPPPEAARAGLDLTVGELIVAFWPHAETYYRGPDGAPTAELDNLRLAVRPLRRLYEGT